ncbi:hypothetical protein, partial [Luteococcus sp.]|uniref:hypothetical protein n=1 Tax=Luteococcus sp. TaxID=1969402 RepID=UPI003736DD10
SPVLPAVFRTLADHAADGSEVGEMFARRARHGIDKGEVFVCQVTGTGRDRVVRPVPSRVRAVKTIVMGPVSQTRWGVVPAAGPRAAVAQAGRVAPRRRHRNN